MQFRDMKNFFEPKKIVIIGVSENKKKVGYVLAKKFKNNNYVFFVNNKRKNILGKKCYKDLSEINDKIDLIIIAIPPVFVNDILKEAEYNGIKNAIIITAGVKLELYNNLRILGPNCFGIVNTMNNFDCTFAKDFPIKGKIDFISQSGALWSSIASYSLEENIGFSKFVSLGDMFDIDFNDILEYSIKDKMSSVILLYIEGLKDGTRLLNLIENSKKPIVVLKGGKTQSGAKATLSHTGSLAGSYDIYKSTIMQFGGYFAESLFEAIDSAKFLSLQKGLIGKRIVIVTNAGGPGVLLSDILEGFGYVIVKLPKNFNLPGRWSKNNPIDIIGDADHLKYEEVLRRLPDDIFDILLVVLTPQEMIDEYKVAKIVINYFKRNKKAVICCFMGKKSIDKAAEFLEKNNIMCFRSIERICGILKVLKPK